MFGIFVFFAVNLRHFHSEHCNFLFNQDYWTYQFFIIDPLKHSTKSVEILTKMHKNFQNWIFVISGVNLRLFHLKNVNTLFGKAYRTTHSLLLDPCQRSNLQSLSKNWAKTNESFENWKKIWTFVIFGANLR